jgi:hypothetical protein
MFENNSLANYLRTSTSDNGSLPVGGFPIAALHEASHAIAKVLAAPAMGWTTGQAITRICMEGDGGKAGGPAFSREMVEKSEFELQNTPGGLEGSIETKVIELARVAGADIESWFNARVFDAVSGSMGEAIYTGTSFKEVWMSRESVFI